MSRWSTREYRQGVVDSCKARDEQELGKMASVQKKCERIMADGPGRKNYMKSKTLTEVRKTFCTRVQMQPYGGNYSRDNRFKKTNWLCFCGEAREEEEHLRGGECPVYGDIRKEFPDDMDDEHLVDFFTLVLERRKRLGEEEEEDEEEEESGGAEVLAEDTLSADVASPPGQASIYTDHQ